MPKKKRNQKQKQQTDCGTAGKQEPDAPEAGPSHVTPTCLGGEDAAVTGAQPKQTMESTECLAKQLATGMTITTPKSTIQFPARPGVSQLTQTVRLTTNHFLLKFNKDICVYHYDIEIEATGAKEHLGEDSGNDKIKGKKSKYTRKTATRINRIIFQKMIDSYSNNGAPFDRITAVYDGQKNMYTSRILPGTEAKASALRLAVSIQDNGRDVNYHVNIKLAASNAKIDLSLLRLYHEGRFNDDKRIQQLIQFLDVMLRHLPSIRMVPIGVSIYDESSKRFNIGKYLEMKFGHYQSVRNVAVGATLNVDRSATFFTKAEKVEDYICSVLNIEKASLGTVPRITDAQLKKIKRDLNGLQIEATHIKYSGRFRKYRVVGITNKSAAETKFNWKKRDADGKEKDMGEISVAQYFNNEYGRLQYPNLPCLVVGNNKVNMPIEVCQIIANQRVRRALTTAERSEMTKIAGTQKPLERIADIQQYVRTITEINRPFLHQFNITIDPNPVNVNAKIIPPPQLEYAENKTVSPKNGQWAMFRTKSLFYKPVHLIDWIIVDFSSINQKSSSLNKKQIHNFLQELKSQGKEMGLTVNDPLIVATVNSYTPYENLIKTKVFNRAKENFPDLQLICFLMPFKDNAYSDELYSEIKLIGDVHEGIATQCVNVTNVRKFNRSLLGNLLLKVNPKLGGINVKICDENEIPAIFRNKKLMIIGADVNHPAPADKVSPSIAAAVGSYDEHFCKYRVSLALQERSREEMIKKLDVMIIELLKEYQEKREQLPEQILFYRDGVSEGQFQDVIEHEYPLFQEAFKSFGPKYEPKITFVVVQKRHHTRFVRANAKQSDKHHNISPGTVVDTMVVHPKDFDFYLCSHEGIQGTSRPSHYYVLADENKFSADDLYRLTYYMCHIYARCTRAVSIPAPVYYAHLAAYRAKVHLSGFNDLDSTGNESSIRSGEEPARNLSLDDLRKRIIVAVTQSIQLYYC